MFEWAPSTLRLDPGCSVAVLSGSRSQLQMETSNTSSRASTSLRVRDCGNYGLTDLTMERAQQGEEG
jgi:hypothetical protein